MPSPFILVCPSSRGLSFALTRHLLKTTTLPVYATHRSGEPETLKQKLISQLDVDPARLNLLPLDLSSESSISHAADSLAASLKSHESVIHTAFLTGGILHAERQPQDLDLGRYQIHLRYQRYLPSPPHQTLFALPPFVADEKIDGARARQMGTRLRTRWIDF